MKGEHTYDPEDIESLLMHKQFNELFEEERNFILQHVEGEEEYESLRKTLYELHNVAFESELIDPDPSIKAAIMKEFASERKGGFMVWLNSLFSFPEVIWYKQPAFKLALVSACIIGISFLFVYNRNSETSIAENKSVEENSITTLLDVADSNSLFAENHAADQFPPAPKQLPAPTTLDPKTNNISIIRESETKDTEQLRTELLQDEMPTEKKSITITEDATSGSKINSSKDKANVEGSDAAFMNTTPPATNEKFESELLKEVAISQAHKSQMNKIQSVATATQLATVEEADNEYTWTPAPVSNSIAASDMKDLISLLYTAQ